VIALTSEVTFINPKTAELRAIRGSLDDAPCLKFEPSGSTLAVGTDVGELFQLSVRGGRAISADHIFQTSVLCCSWSGSALFAGARDVTFGNLDTKSNEWRTRTDVHHEEICSISFQSDASLFATSSNDTTAKIWDVRRMESPLRRYSEHCAAVRALAWSPVARAVVVSGGGTSNKMIRVWNAEIGEMIGAVNSGSQVCNLCWNEEYNEIQSTHGFSQHQLGLWRASDLAVMAQFYEHKQRVLFMGPSPDGTRIATAAPNDGLRIWKMFPSTRMSVTDSMFLLR
jgi:cell division cycle 20-like protein 1 (cofactor of APC complex)